MKKCIILFLCLSLLFCLCACEWQDLPFAQEILSYINGKEPDKPDIVIPDLPDKPGIVIEKEPTPAEIDPDPPEEEPVSSYEIRLQNQKVKEKDASSPDQITQ